MKETTALLKIAALKHRNKAIQGSQGAGKTYSILSRWVVLAAKSKVPNICSIVTDTFPNLRSGAIRDFEAICNNEELVVYKTKTPHVFKIGLWTFEFFSVDKESKALGGRRDRLFINEANRLPWKTARQLISRTHKECIFDYNPVARFWVHIEFVDTEFCDFLKLTYKDNEQLPKSEVEAIEHHAPWGRSPDPNYWRVYGLGEIGFVEGQILTYEEFTELPESLYQEAIGMDWGWEDPEAAVKVWVDHENKRIYWKELFYASKTSEEAMFKAILESEDYNEDKCPSDHTPRSIMNARSHGLAALNAIKPQLPDRIRTVMQYSLFIHSESLNLRREVDNWKYQERKGEIINYPDQTCEDHAIDAAMYGTCFIIRK